MALRRVNVTDLRCLRFAEFELDPRFTLISGPNGSGKTSVLEALYLLGRGRSFRTRKLEKLIRTGSDRFMVFGEALRGGLTVPLGIEGSVDGMRGKVGGQWAKSLSELAAILPVQIIDPEVHRLIEESPGRRRRFIDWGVFHVEQNFVHTWQRFQLVLRQRNAALRLRQPRLTISAWDPELVRLGEYITDARRRYVVRLEQIAASITQRLLGGTLTLSYRPGWGGEEPMQDAMVRSWARDCDRGLTHVGPQRAELGIQLDGASVKDRISRGQQKLLAAGLLLAQLELLPREGGVEPVLLLDDPAAELDSDRLAELIQSVRRDSVQLVITSLGTSLAGFGLPGRGYLTNEGRLEKK